MPGIHQDVHLSAVPAISSGVSPSVPVQLYPSPPPPPLSTPQLSGRAAWCRAPAAEGWPPPRSLLSPCVPGASTEDYALLSPIFQDCIAWHRAPLNLVTKLHVPIVAGLQTTNWVFQGTVHSLYCTVGNSWNAFPFQMPGTTAAQCICVSCTTRWLLWSNEKQLMLSNYY